MKFSNRLEKITIIPEKNKKYFWGYPDNVVVVGVRADGKENFMPCVWNVGLSYDPFLFGVSIGNDRHTYELMEKAESFTINFVEFKHAQTIRALGRSTGKEIDKEEGFNLKVSEAEKINAPVLDLAYCTYECMKKDEKRFGDHTLFVGEVVSIKIEKRAIGDYQLLNAKEILPLVYLGVDHYITTDPEKLLSLKELPFHYKDEKPK